MLCCQHREILIYLIDTKNVRIKGCTREGNFTVCFYTTMLTTKDESIHSLTKDDKEDFIRGHHCDGCRDHWSGVLQQRIEVRLNSEYKKGKVGVTGREQDEEVGGWKITKKKLESKELWLT